MKHRIGYACINTSIDATTNRTCRLSNCTEEKLRELISGNLSGLKKILQWNLENEILLYRISSVIIPFASHEVNKIRWWEEFKDELSSIGEFIRNTNMRVSMHPGQFVNINSPNKEIVRLSIKDLEWHNRFLDSLGLDLTHRLIIHTGGVYGEKETAMTRFAEVYNRLPENIKSRLSLENDDKSYDVWDVLAISKETGIPVVFDFLHHQVKNSGRNRDDDISSILQKCFDRWNKTTGKPKIHYSTQKPGAKPGSHADSINVDEFITFYSLFQDLVFDIMLETKDKEKSAIEVIKRIKTLY